MLARKYEPSAVLAQMQAGSWRALMPYPFALPFGYLVLHAIWDTMVLRALARADARGVVRRVTREIAA